MRLTTEVYQIVGFWYASVAYQVNSVSPWKQKEGRAVLFGQRTWYAACANQKIIFLEKGSVKVVE